MFRIYRKTLFICMEYNVNIQNCKKNDVIDGEPIHGDV